jgi:prepilin-type N-terminal cleavage/methylation domain-containing protein
MKRKGERGFSLVEVVVAVALMGIIGVMLAGALGTTSKILLSTDVNETAKNCAEAHMEYIKSLPYDSSYLPRDLSAAYPGFSLVTGNGGRIYAQDMTGVTDSNIQKIELTVQFDSKNIITISDYKTR